MSSKFSPDPDFYRESQKQLNLATSKVQLNVKRFLLHTEENLQEDFPYFKKSRYGSNAKDVSNQSVSHFQKHTRSLADPELRRQPHQFLSNDESTAHIKTKLRIDGDYQQPFNAHSLPQIATTMANSEQKIKFSSITESKFSLTPSKLALPSGFLSPTMNFTSKNSLFPAGSVDKLDVKEIRHLGSWIDSMEIQRKLEIDNETDTLKKLDKNRGLTHSYFTGAQRFFLKSRDSEEVNLHRRLIEGLQSCFFYEVYHNKEFAKQIKEELKTKNKEIAALKREIASIRKNESIEAYFAKFYNLNAPNALEEIRANLVARVETYLKEEATVVNKESLEEAMKVYPSKAEAHLTVLTMGRHEEMPSNPVNALCTPEFEGTKNEMYNKIRQGLLDICVEISDKAEENYKVKLRLNKNGLLHQRGTQSLDWPTLEKQIKSGVSKDYDVLKKQLEEETTRRNDFKDRLTEATKKYIELKVENESLGEVMTVKFATSMQQYLKALASRLSMQLRQSFGQHAEDPIKTMLEEHAKLLSEISQGNLTGTAETNAEKKMADYKKQQEDKKKAKIALKVKITDASADLPKLDLSPAKKKAVVKPVDLEKIKELEAKVKYYEGRLTGALNTSGQDLLGKIVGRPAVDVYAEVSDELIEYFYKHMVVMKEFVEPITSMTITDAETGDVISMFKRDICDLEKALNEIPKLLEVTQVLTSVRLGNHEKARQFKADSFEITRDTNKIIDNSALFKKAKKTMESLQELSDIEAIFKDVCTYVEQKFLKNAVSRKHAKEYREKAHKFLQELAKIEVCKSMMNSLPNRHDVTVLEVVIEQVQDIDQRILTYAQSLKMSSKGLADHRDTQAVMEAVLSLLKLRGELKQWRLVASSQTKFSEGNKMQALKDALAKLPRLSEVSEELTTVVQPLGNKINALVLKLKEENSLEFQSYRQRDEPTQPTRPYAKDQKSVYAIDLRRSFSEVSVDNAEKGQWKRAGKVKTKQPSARLQFEELSTPPTSGRPAKKSPEKAQISPKVSPRVQPSPKEIIKVQPTKTKTPEPVQEDENPRKKLKNGRKSSNMSVASSLKGQLASKIAKAISKTLSPSPDLKEQLNKTTVNLTNKKMSSNLGNTAAIAAISALKQNVTNTDWASENRNINSDLTEMQKRTMTTIFERGQLDTLRENTPIQAIAKPKIQQASKGTQANLCECSSKELIDADIQAQKFANDNFNQPQSIKRVVLKKQSLKSPMISTSKLESMTDHSSVEDFSEKRNSAMSSHKNLLSMDVSKKTSGKSATMTKEEVLARIEAKKSSYLIQYEEDRVEAEKTKLSYSQLVINGGSVGQVNEESSEFEEQEQIVNDTPQIFNSSQSNQNSTKSPKKPLTKLATQTVLFQNEAGMSFTNLVSLTQKNSYNLSQKAGVANGMQIEKTQDTARLLDLTPLPNPENDDAPVRIGGGNQLLTSKTLHTPSKHPLSIENYNSNINMGFDENQSTKNAPTRHHISANDLNLGGIGLSYPKYDSLTVQTEFLKTLQNAAISVQTVIADVVHHPSFALQTELLQTLQIAVANIEILNQSQQESQGNRDEFQKERQFFVNVGAGTQADQTLVNQGSLTAQNFISHGTGNTEQILVNSGTQNSSFYYNPNRVNQLTLGDPGMISYITNANNSGQIFLQNPGTQMNPIVSGSGAFQAYIDQGTQNTQDDIIAPPQIVLRHGTQISPFIVNSGSENVQTKQQNSLTLVNSSSQNQLKMVNQGTSQVPMMASPGTNKTSPIVVNSITYVQQNVNLQIQTQTEPTQYILMIPQATQTDNEALVVQMLGYFNEVMNRIIAESARNDSNEMFKTIFERINQVNSLAAKSILQEGQNLFVQGRSSPMSLRRLSPPNLAPTPLTTMSPEKMLAKNASARSLRAEAVQQPTIPGHQFFGVADYSKFGNHPLNLENFVKERVTVKEMGRIGGGFNGSAVVYKKEQYKK